MRHAKEWVAQYEAEVYYPQQWPVILERLIALAQTEAIRAAYGACMVAEDAFDADETRAMKAIRELAERTSPP